MWALNTIAPSATARLVAAVPQAFVMTREHVRLVAEFIDSLFPMSPGGYAFDLYVSNADINSYTPGGDSRTDPDHPHQRRPARLPSGE